MRARSLSIRTILLLIISALTLMITLLAAKEVFVNWQQLEKIRSLQQAMAISDTLFDATEKLATERDIAYTILHAPDSATIHSLRPRLEESRRAADAAFKVSMDALKQYDFSELTPINSKVETQLQAIQKLRQQINRAVAHLPQQQEKALSNRWFAESTTLIVQIQDLWVEFSKHFTNIDPIVTQHLRYKHFLRVISDYTGRERAIIGRLIVENADPTPDEFAQLLRGQGIIEIGWKFTGVLARQSGLVASTPYYDDARSHYLTLYGMVHDIFYIPGGRHGASYPISADLWLELSSQAKESFAALKEAALKEIRNHVILLETHARQAIFLHISVLLFSLMLSAYSFSIIIRRVIRPIKAMVEALINTTQGKTVALPPVANADDEIGKLMQVLHAFRENSERYRALIEASSQVIFTWRPTDNSGMTSVLQWWENTTGQPAAEILPNGWAKDVHPDDREEAQKIWAHATATGYNYDMEYRIRKKNGEYCWVYVRGVGLKYPDGTIREFVGALSDITERKEAQQAIQDSADRLRAVFDTVVDGIITIDVHATIQGFNKSAQRIFGYAASEVIGRNVNMLMPAPYHAAHDGYVDNYLKTGQAKIIGIGREVQATRKDGSVFPIELGVNEFRIGAERAFVGIIRDISERKAAEAKALLYMHALERSNKELDDFAYIASHDLKEPLRGLFNHATFLLEDYKDKLDEDGVRKLHRLSYLSQRMERLVNDLLYFSRLGRQEMAIQPADMNEVIHDIEPTLEVFLGERHAKILVPKKLPTVTCDKTRVTEVFRNLITNAVKYNDKPKKTVEIGFLEDHAAPDGAAYDVFYVKDNGKGIAAEFYEEIFRIFKRLQGTKDSPEEGTGAGLTFVKKIIERHGGKIWLESEVGKGTVFYFTLG